MIDVAAGVLIDGSGRVLIAQRPAGKHMAGFWEFPGGKFEAGENAAQALARELEEELGIQIAGSEALIQLRHDYPDRSVCLHVRVVREWRGSPQSLDQQALEWVSPQALTDWALLPADAPIVRAIQLPSCYAISPLINPNMDWPQLESQLQPLLAQNITLLQWRQAAFMNGSLASLSPQSTSWRQAQRLSAWAKQHRLTLLLNTELSPRGIGIAVELGFDGIHASNQQLALSAKTQLAAARKNGLSLLGASVHDEKGLSQAAEKGFDFAVLGAVKFTQTHPNASPLGWPQFAQWVSAAKLPTYALGGCDTRDIAAAKVHGGQGVAAISGFWKQA